MTDWGSAFDEQCRSEGLEVTEKIEEHQSNSEMNLNEENKGSIGSGISRGGMFGVAKTVNAPPPQTSFGSTFGTRASGSFANQIGPDGRGAAIGSSEDMAGGGNVVSVAIHKEKSACSIKRGGSFGTNRSMTPCAQANIKTNHKGGRFGVLPSRTLSPASVDTTNQQQKATGGDRFGETSTSKLSFGGAFGSKNYACSNNVRSSSGAVAAKNPNFAATPVSPKVAGREFVSQKNSPISTELNLRYQEDPVPLSSSESDKSIKRGFKFLSREEPVPVETVSQNTSSSVNSIKSEYETGSRVDPVRSSITLGSTSTSTSSIKSSGSIEVSNSTIDSKSLPENNIAAVPVLSFGGAFGASRSNFGTGTVGGAFGRKPATTEIADLSTPPPSIHRIRSDDKKPSHVTTFGKSSDPKLGMTERREEKQWEGVFARSSTSQKEIEATFQDVLKTGEEKENNCSVARNTADSESRSVTTRLNSTDRSLKTLSIHESNVAQSQVDRKEPNDSNVPFMTGPHQNMRGGIQGTFRGRSSGGQLDFGDPIEHPIGRGRAQPVSSYVPPQRGSTPPFAGHQALQGAKPDPKFKYTKPVAGEVHEKVPIPADIALLNKFIQKEVKMMKDMVVDVQRQDPKSPLYSISSFRELRLKPEVLRALDTFNFQFPTRIQETALPLLLMEPPSNLIAQAQSGTGKTAAFVLTMLCRIDVNLKCPQCICLAPTLELAKQIGEVVEKMGKYIENLKIHYAVKGGNMDALRGRKLTEQIVIGTPGVTRDYLQKYHCIDPSQIRCLVLDEADVMIYHQGFTDISTTIYNMVEEASDSVQSMLFSATYDEPVIAFATKIIKNAIVVMLKREEQALPNIKQFYVQCACRDSKYAAIVNLYSGLAVASSVIFCHTKASVMWLYENMKARKHQVDVLHGDMTVVERADTIIRFKRGDFKVLITTNVFARGIDVAQVSVVINYDLPIKYNDQGSAMVVDGFTQPDCETYLHRIGRTGRFGKTGIAINLIDSEDSMNMINVLENHFQMTIARMDPSNLIELEAIEMV